MGRFAVSDDANKVLPTICGCGVADDDSDGDGVPDCFDQCPDDPGKLQPGPCGCGSPDSDTDGDGWLDCVDNCPNDPNSDQADANDDGIGDVCTPPPAGADNPCAPAGVMLGMMPLMLLTVRRQWTMRRKR